MNACIYSMYLCVKFDVNLTLTEAGTGQKMMFSLGSVRPNSFVKPYSTVTADEASAGSKKRHIIFLPCKFGPLPMQTCTFTSTIFYINLRSINNTFTSTYTHK